MKFLRTYPVRVLFILTGLAVAGLGGLAWWSASEIGSPSRRPIMDYHREYLDAPGAHGLKIDAFTAGDGTPCLVCLPAGQPAKRGAAIRSQLAARGLMLPAFGEVRGTLVLTHGRKGRKEDYLPIAERLCACGFRCVIPDLPAHGDHPGKIATFGIREAGLPARVLEEAANRFSFDPRPAGLMGMSMGGSVAVHAADAPGAPWKALVVIASFDSFPPVIERQTAGILGSALAPTFARAVGGIYQSHSGIALEEIQPWKHAEALRIPTLIAHGTADPVIPLAGGRRLFDSIPASTQKKWVEIPGADHNRVLVTDYPIYADIAEWMLRNVR